MAGRASSWRVAFGTLWRRRCLHLLNSASADRGHEACHRPLSSGITAAASCRANAGRVDCGNCVRLSRSESAAFSGETTNSAGVALNTPPILKGTNLGPAPKEPAHLELKLHASVQFVSVVRRFVSAFYSQTLRDIK